MYNWVLSVYCCKQILWSNAIQPMGGMQAQNRSGQRTETLGHYT